MPTPGQIGLLIFSIACFVAGGALSLGRLRGERAGLRVAAKACLYAGAGAALAVLAWHSIDRRTWVPLDDNFDALVWLGLLLAAFLLYVQGRRPLPGLDWFVLPVVVVLLSAAGVFGQYKPHDYVAGAWDWVHRVTAYGGAVAFAVAGAAGAMYLLNHRRLRSKLPAPGPNLGSLERLEHWTFLAVTLGFALLTIGLVTGVAKVLHPGPGTRLGRDWFASPKVVLAFSVWVVYALVLHSPINPSFRGRKAAMLSILGLVLMIGTIVAVQYMPALPADAGNAGGK